MPGTRYFIYATSFNAYITMRSKCCYLHSVGNDSDNGYPHTSSISIVPVHAVTHSFNARSSPMMWVLLLLPCFDR